MRVFASILALAMAVAACSTAPPAELPATSNPDFRVLVFSKTSGYRHDSIEPGIAAIQAMGQQHNFGVTTTEDSLLFNPANLSRYKAVIFLNTSKDVLGPNQESAFQEYIRAGGAFVGVHAAADTEYDWPWYGKLVGAWFDSHPDQQSAAITFTDRQHPSTAGLPTKWEHFDEWYNYKPNPRKDLHVLATVDEKSYEGGNMGHDHPISWAHEFDGGRSWYTGLGHTVESYADPVFLEHLLEGIRWAVGETNADVTASRASAWQKVVLSGDLTDPMELDITSDGRVFITEWAGTIKIYEPRTGRIRVAGWLPVEKVIEDGLHGLALDPGFDDNGWMYIYYSTRSEGRTINRLSRFTYDGKAIDRESEIPMLEIPVQRVQCCHSGGSVQIDHRGLLYLSTGDNTGGQRDHPDETIRRMADQGRSAMNTNDLRGKILRIKPEPDGSYTIPEGNLFEPDEKHRGEIYTMGHRSPWRIAIDDSTGWVYWGDVGPNAGGAEEINQAKEPGFFGWPMFTDTNVVYTNYRVPGVDMEPLRNPDQPINASPFNTGAREIPPAQKAWIPYYYGPSESFPELEAGGANPMAGPIFHYDAATAHEHAVPRYYDDKVLIYEWMRHWLMTVTLEDDGGIADIEPFLPGITFSRPSDIEIAPDGRMYVLEWGDAFWGSNKNAQLVRLDYYGTKSQPEPVESLSVLDRAKWGPVSIKAPIEGSFFDFGEPFQYAVAVMDQAISEQLKVNLYSGFDTTPLLIKTKTPSLGTITVGDEYTHVPDVHYADRFAMLEACLGEPAGSPTCDRIKLHPRTKEVEHFTTAENSRRVTYSARPASLHWGGTALTIMTVQNGSRIAYDPVYLGGVDSLTVRFRAEKESVVEFFHSDASAPVASFSAGPEVGRPVIPRQEFYLQGVPPEEPGLAQLAEGAFERWREITIPLAAPRDPGVLEIRVTSSDEGTVAELDWVRFGSRAGDRRQAVTPDRR